MKKLRKLYPLVLMAGVLVPVFVAAQGDLRDHIETMQDIVEVFIPFLMTVAVAIFLYGIVMFISAAGDTEKVKSAKGYILFGILGLFVLVAFWGLVWVLSETFDIDEESSPLMPDTYVY